MNSNFKSLAFGVALLAALLCINWSEAQKTISNSFQQQQISEGSNPNGVYGGYSGGPIGGSSSNSFRRTNSFQQVAPVSNQQRRVQQSSYSNSQQQSRQPAFSFQQPQQTEYSSSSSSSYESQQAAEADAEPASYGSVNGKPGVDFPAYTQVPRTSFSCDGLPYDYGMYADEETGCQAYHVCYNGRKDSFLCGVGTVFNQRILHCDYWYSVDCAKSSQYYGSNAYMGSSQPEPGPAQASGSQQSYKQRTSSSSSSINRPTNYQQASSSYVNNQNQQQLQDGY